MAAPDASSKIRLCSRSSTRRDFPSATAQRWRSTGSTSPSNEGEVYGYLGPNGSGKTTTIRLLLGLHRPSGGRAELFGIDAWGDPVQAHRRVAYVAGEPFLWPALTSAETFEFLARLHGGTDIAYREPLVERFQLDRDKKIRALSKGNRQKVQLIAALAHARRAAAARRAHQRP